MQLSDNFSVIFLIKHSTYYNVTSVMISQTIRRHNIKHCS